MGAFIGMITTLPIFSHPDYTVGFGISPNHVLMHLRTITAGREFHPALKTSLFFLSLTGSQKFCKPSLVDKLIECQGRLYDKPMAYGG